MHELLAPLLSDALVLSVAHKHAEAGGCLTYVPIKQLAKAILSAECRLSLVKKYTAQLRLWPTSFLSLAAHRPDKVCGGPEHIPGEQRRRPYATVLVWAPA